jgi:hypothetical protein
VIYAFDPGKITGVATWSLGGGFWSGQFTVHELYEYVDAACERIGYAQIERFTISAGTIRKAPEPDPLDVIGYLKYAAWRCDFKIGWTKPADVMRSFPDGALRKAGMYLPGKGHANDAARHLAWHLVQNRLRPASDFLV